MKTIASTIEPLEARIAPAAIYSWLDVDGDMVTIKTSVGLSSDLKTLMEFHRVSAGVPGGYRINEIDFTDVVTADEFANAAVTVSVVRAAHGDGRVDLGYIKATALPLKSFVAPKASIQSLDCGDTKNAIGTLQIASYGTSAPGYFNNGIADQLGVLSGNVGSIKIAGDIEYGGLEINNGHVGSPTVGSITVGGNLVGTASSATTHAGQLLVFEPVTGAVKIGGSIIGGPFDSSFLAAPFNGAGNYLGFSNTLSIGGDIVGAAGASSGIIFGSAKNATIRGSILGGSGLGSGVVFLNTPSKITIGGNVEGGTKPQTGIIAGESVSGLVIKGSVIGGVTDTSMRSDAAGSVLFTKDIGSIFIGGNLIAGGVTGGNYNFNGSIDLGGNVQSIHIGGSVLGTDQSRALILAHGTTPAKADVSFNAIGSLTVGGSVEYALIASGHDSEQPVGKTPTSIANLGDALNPDAGIGSVTIGHDFYHSSILAGTNDNNSMGAGRINGATSYDTQSVGDAPRIAQLGPVVIKGALLDDYSSSGFSGFEAERISKITAGGIVVFRHGAGLTFFDPNHFVFAQEIPVS